MTGLVEECVRKILEAEDEEFREVPLLVQRVIDEQVRLTLRLALPHLSPESRKIIEEELK